jgi:hypothetical protein
VYLSDDNTPYGACELLELCPNVTEVSLFAYRRPDEEFIATCDQRLLMIAESCPTLERIEISVNYVTSAGLVRFVAECCSTLREICAPSLDVDEDDIVEISRLCPQLRLLDVSDEALVETAQGCPDLQEFDMLTCSRVTDTGVLALAENGKLVSLAVAHSTEITDTSLVEVAKQCANLRSLYISRCSNVTDVTLLHFGANCAYLQSLTVVGGFVCSVTSLQRLSYCQCTCDVTSLIEALTYCPYLKSLHQSEAKQDEWIAHPVLAALPKKLYVTFDCCASLGFHAHPR